MRRRAGSHQSSKEREQFIGRLRQCLARLKWNQREFAEAIEVSQSAVSDWMNVSLSVMPDGYHMLMLPRVLGVNGHWLLTGEGSIIPTHGQLHEYELRVHGAQSVIDAVREVLDRFEESDPDVKPFPSQPVPRKP